MAKTIRVHILGREYTLRVAEENESTMRALAARLDEDMRDFRDRHPTQPEITAAVITALALAEELQRLREAHAQTRHTLDDELDVLTRRLDKVLPAAAASDAAASDEET